jgi:hypothetical protein
MIIKPNVCRGILSYVSGEEAEFRLTYPDKKNNQAINRSHAIPILRAIRDAYRELQESPNHLQVYYTVLARTWQEPGILVSPVGMLRYLGRDPALGNPTRWGRVLRHWGIGKSILQYRGDMRNMSLYFIPESQILLWTKSGMCSTKNIATPPKSW